MAVWVIPAASGSFDSGAHGEAVSTFAQGRLFDSGAHGEAVSASAQDDRVWVG